MRKNDSASKFLFVMIFAAIFLMSQAVLAVEIMPVKDIKPGMKGYGYTVYQGVMPEKFKFEVLGVDYFYNTAVDSPVVLVKLTSGPKDFPPEKTGVVAGMSGSPMYINGKLVGALAYGFGKLPKDPIAGIQPAENMLDPHNKTNKVGGANRNIPLVLSMPNDMVDLFTKVDRFKNDPYFKDNFVIKAAAHARSTTEEADADLKMQPGSSLNVYIAKGDITMSANGTVTMVEGDKIYAFGHPFFGFGEVEMPFHQAAVITTLSDYADSYKMAGGDVGTVAGTITDDYYSAINGTIGKTPRMLALGLRLEGPDGVRTVKVDVAKLPALTAKVVGAVAINSINRGYLEVACLPANTAQEMTIKTKINFYESPPITMTGSYGFKFHGTPYGEDLIGVTISDDLIWAITEYINEFGPIILEMERRGVLNKISGISIEVVFAKVPEKNPVSPNENVEIKEIALKAKSANKGSIVFTELTFIAAKGNKITEYTVTIPVPVPGDAVPGSDVEMTVGKGTALMSLADVADATLEDVIRYYSNLSKPGLFMRLVYQVTDKPAEKTDDSAIRFGNLGSAVITKKATKTKLIFYTVPTSFTIGRKGGLASATLTIKEETKKESATKRDGWFHID